MALPCCRLPALAAESMAGKEKSSEAYDTDFSFLNEDGKGAFDTIGQKSRETGAGIYQIVVTAGTIIFVISLFITGYMFLFGKSTSRSEAKTQISLVIVCIIIFFGAVALASEWVRIIVSF